MTRTESSDELALEGNADDSAALLPAVTELAHLAGEIALGYFDQARRSQLLVEHKGDGSPVTVADRNAELAARDWVERYFPRDGFVGEETGAARSGSRRRWIVDPIDGTKSFVRGVPLWGTLVAVAEGDKVIAGAINCAATGELVAAALGQGCWLNGGRCFVSAEHQLARATVLATDERFPHVSVDPGATASAAELERTRCWDGWRRVAERAAVARSWGDCYGYLLVATGRAEAMFDAIMAPWDTAALWPVITEAGGVITDWNARATAFGGSSVATNAALAVEVRTLLTARQAGPG